VAAALGAGPLLDACGGGGTIDFYAWQGYDLSPGVTVMKKWLQLRRQRLRRRFLCRSRISLTIARSSRPCPTITTLALRSCLSPRTGRSLAFNRP
jgi:hypothetical protein